jgi:hypothetical protein
MSKRTTARETDNAYFLKILVYFVLGMVWVKVNGYVVLPIGLIVGVIISHHDHFAIDRKIEYAVLIISSLLGLYGYGAFIGLWFGQ